MNKKDFYSSLSHIHKQTILFIFIYNTIIKSNINLVRLTIG